MLIFHELSPSLNSTKVRMALRFKGIEFEAREVDHESRAALVEVSGQELSPVIEHDGRVLNDSEAILNYLDANWRDAPRLIPADRDGRRRSDSWKSELDQRCGAHWFPTFFHTIGLREEGDEASRAAFAESMVWLDGELDSRSSFGAPIDDLRVAEWATYAFPGAPLIARCPLFRKLQENYGVDQESLPRLQAFLAPWQERLG